MWRPVVGLGTALALLGGAAVLWLRPPEAIRRAEPPGVAPRSDAAPVRLAPGAPAGTLARLVAQGREGRADAWERLRAVASGLAEADRTVLRRALDSVLAAAVHETADYQGGADAVQLAAAVADEETCERLLALLTSWDRVVLKLPLTERRDDLAVLDAVIAAVRSRGTEEQNARLDRWLAAADYEVKEAKEGREEG